MKVELQDVVIAYGTTRLVCAKIVGYRMEDDGERWRVERTSDVPDDPVGISDTEMALSWWVRPAEIIANLGPDPILGIKVAGVTVEVETGYYDCAPDGAFAVSIIAESTDKEVSTDQLNDDLYDLLCDTHEKLSPISWGAQFNVQMRPGEKKLPIEVSERKRLLTVYLAPSMSEEYAQERLALAWGIATASWRLLGENSKLAWAKAYADYVSVHTVPVALMEAGLTTRAGMTAKEFKGENPDLQNAVSVWCKHVKSVYRFDNDTVANLLKRGTWRDYLPAMDLFWSEREDDMFGDAPLPSPQVMYGRALALAKLGYSLPDSIHKLTSETLALPWNTYNQQDSERLEEMRANFTRNLEATED